jgi:activating signal cointegrator 1
MDWIGCVSIPQPRASLLAQGSIEVALQNYPTDYRGEMMIHAGEQMPAGSFWRLSMWRELLRESGFDSPEQMPLGAFVGVAELACCLPMPTCGQPSPNWLRQMDPEQRALLGAGKWAWIFEYARPIVPIPAAGGVGVWGIPRHRVGLEVQRV